MTVALSALMTLSHAANSANFSAEEAGALPEEIDITAERLSFKDVAQQTVVVDVNKAISLRLDSILASVPGAGLFRRANSLSAHPTTQGLGLRAIGANAAGRTLVTYDGVPINDPFGGWVYWSGIQKQAVSEVRVQKGGSAGAYGAQALAGSVDIISKTPEEDGGFVSASYGAFDTFDISAGLNLVGEKGYLSLTGGHFETDGFFLFSEEQRGSVDVPAASEADTITLKGRYDLGENTHLFPTVRLYREDRVNGLALATNETDAVDVSLRVLHEASSGALFEVTSFFRNRDFSNLFVSARDERTTERPVLDQFDIPGWGAGLLARVQIGNWEFGVDGRRNSGETNENFRNLGAGFTRLRVAGGDQWIVGAYTDYEAQNDWGSFSGTFRLDRYKTYNGSRIETNIDDGSSVRNDEIANQSDWQWSGRLGVERRVTGAIDVRAAAYKSWRLPTINEFYRPFRVVNDITEANPNLVPEKLYGIEVGVDYEPLNTFKVSATYYRNWLTDGVGNVTIGFGPGFFPLGGFVPGGGVLRQRSNIDRSITDGIELEGRLKLQHGWELTGSYLYARSRITEFDARPELEGLRPVQTPKHTGVAALQKTYSKGFMKLEARYQSGQFDDDLNTRRLDNIFTVNAAVSHEVAEGVSLTVSAENIFDAEVISAVTSTGLETIAQRRFWRVGLQADF